MAGPLRLVHGIGDPHELVELALELGPLLHEGPREGRVTGSRLPDQRRADRRRFRAGHVVEDTVGDALGNEQLLVVPQPGDEPALAFELTLAHRAELFGDLDHAEEFRPVGAAQRFQLPPPYAEPLGDGLELPPFAVAASGGAPRATVTLDRRQRRLGPLRALVVDQLGDRHPLELGGQVTQPATVRAAPIASIGTLPAPVLAIAPVTAAIAMVGRAAPVSSSIARHVERGLERPHVGLDVADALEVLVLAER